MSRSSEKYINFLSEPIGEKHVTELPGIDEDLGKMLESAGFDKAYVVLGQFLVLKKNMELFQEWLVYICGVDSNQSYECYQCLNDWCDEYL